MYYFEAASQLETSASKANAFLITITALMARLSTVNSPAPDPTAINLTRMIARLQRILISPDQGTESKLRNSSLERDKVGTVRHTPSLLCTTQTLFVTAEYRTRPLPPPQARTRRAEH